MDLLAVFSVAHCCVSMRVGRVVCKVSSLAKHAKVSEPDVQAFLALIDDFGVGASTT